MKKYFEMIIEERIDYVGSKIKSDNSKYNEILNKIKAAVTPEVFDLINDLEEVIVDDHRIFEEALYKQGFKDGMELKNII